MNGEIGMKIKEIRISEDYETLGITYNDLTFVSDEGHFHICGNNDIEKLLLKALFDYQNRKNKINGGNK